MVDLMTLGQNEFYVWSQNEGNVNMKWNLVSDDKKKQALKFLKISLEQMVKHWFQ